MRKSLYNTYNTGRKTKINDFDLEEDDTIGREDSFTIDPDFDTTDISDIVAEFYDRDGVIDDR